ncbi:MAG: hypothetical protein H6Q05_1010 [Acidobacteria bacterium]|nr:hypothetical protein [Acidobacteriota bacterium]
MLKCFQANDTTGSDYVQDFMHLIADPQGYFFLALSARPCSTICFTSFMRVGTW